MINNTITFLAVLVAAYTSIALYGDMRVAEISAPLSFLACSLFSIGVYSIAKGIMRGLWG